MSCFHQLEGDFVELGRVEGRHAAEDLAGGEGGRIVVAEDHRPGHAAQRQGELLPGRLTPGVELGDAGTGDVAGVGAIERDRAAGLAGLDLHDGGAGDAGLGALLHGRPRKLVGPVEVIVGVGLRRRHLKEIGAELVGGLEAVTLGLAQWAAPADQIEAHLKDCKGPRIVISDERELLLDSAGGIINALPQLGAEPFFILNADTFWVGDEADPNLPRLAKAWDDAAMDILLMTTRFDQATGFEGTGDFVADEEGRLRRARDVAGSPVIYAGAGIIHPRIFSGAQRGVASLNTYFDAAIATGRLYGLPMVGHWLTVGTPKAIDKAEAALSALV